MVLAIILTAAFVGGIFLPLSIAHAYIHGLHLLQATLALFCAINTLICWWEIGLFTNRALIKSQYLAFRKRLRSDELPSPVFLFENVSLREGLSLKYWALVWSTYSLIDPSYQDQTTFGFFVDVGNGFTTLVPSLLYALCMTWPLLPARVAGVIGLLKFYQEFYGCAVYFFSFALNERYKGKSRSSVWLVLISNGIWIVFPLVGLYASWFLIDRNDYSIFR